ncbi:hypothetical protein QTO34_006091 [Cnephaeus nilssonii]|uniref:Uncharacterized protein n=1 Tax=Cnephaeus nilssonii TaxID=3371016 RepID=A0AA40LI99_CNENI|nr:hypothetical protein QTO34_006091 [Eptesicus nilssonii]
MWSGQLLRLAVAWDHGAGGFFVSLAAASLSDLTRAWAREEPTTEVPIAWWGIGNRGQVAVDTSDAGFPIAPLVAPYACNKHLKPSLSLHVVLISSGPIGAESSSTAAMCRRYVADTLCVPRHPWWSAYGISLRDTPPLPGSISDGMNSSAYYNVNFSQAISHNVLVVTLNISYHALEGAVGGYYPDPSKLCHMDLRGTLHFNIFHNHTYHLQPSVSESTSESFSWPGKSQKIRSRYLNDTDRDLSYDGCHAKAPHIPFSVDEIVRMRCHSSMILDKERQVAAQNCHKSKQDIILNPEDDVCNLQAKKETLKSEQAQCNSPINIMKQKRCDLYHGIFSRLNDEGRLVNPNQYALQCSHDRSVLIVPKQLVTAGHKKETQKGKRKNRSALPQRPRHLEGESGCDQKPSLTFNRGDFGYLQGSYNHNSQGPAASAVIPGTLRLQPPQPQAPKNLSRGRQSGTEYVMGPATSHRADRRNS